MPNALVVAVKVLPYNCAMAQRFTKNLLKLGLLPGFFLLTQFLHAQYVHFSPRRDLPIMGCSGLVFGASMYMQYRVTPLDQSQIGRLDKNQIWKFDRIACNYWSPTAKHISDGLGGASVLLPLLFLSNQNTKKDFVAIANVSLKSLALAQALANVSKLGLRNRPFLYNPNAPMSEKLKSDARMSFFSAHTVTVSSSCFSFAFAYNTYFPDSKAKPFIIGSACLLPTVEGFLRVRAGKHYPTDVIVGYLVGLGSAYLMHRLYLVK